MKPRNLLILKIIILLVMYPTVFWLLSLFSDNINYRLTLYVILLLSFIWNMSIMIKIHMDRYNNKYP